MKIGIRKPSIKKSISARTTGKAKRKIKKLAKPFYGKKGMGWVRNPRRALKNKVYRKTTISIKSLGGLIAACIYYPIYWSIVLVWWIVKYTLLGIWWFCVLFINVIISSIGLITNRTVIEATSDSEIPGK